MFSYKRESFFYKIKDNLKEFISNTYDVIASFILRRINLNKVDKNGDTALHRAIKSSNYKTAMRLIKCGADVYVANRKGCTPLHLSVDFDGYEVMMLLIEHGADVNVVDKNGDTLLHNLVVLNHLPLVVALIKHGATVNTVNKKKDTPISIAIRKGSSEMVGLLIQHGADVNACGEDGYTPLVNAIVTGSFELVELLLKHGVDVNACDKDGHTPLVSAIVKGNSKLVDLLLKHGTDINAFDQHGYTPLFEAILLSNPELVDLLINHGADINIVNKCGLTSLKRAVLSYIENAEPLRASSNHSDEQKKKRLLCITRSLMIATLLENINVEKPDFIDMNPSILTLWSDCKVEVEDFLSKIILDSSSFSIVLFLSLYKEKDENKLALISRNKDVKNILKNIALHTDKYPYFIKKIQAQFKKGKARNQALTTAQNAVFTFNVNKQLNEYCWREILEYLPQEDLKNMTRVSSFFYKESPSNGINFSLEKKKSMLKEFESTFNQIFDSIQKSGFSF